MFLIIYEDGEAWVETELSEENKELELQGVLRIFKVGEVPQELVNGEWKEVEIR